MKSDMYDKYLNRIKSKENPINESFVDSTVERLSKFVGTALAEFMNELKAEDSNLASNINKLGANKKIKEFQERFKDSPQFKKFIERQIKKGE